LEQPVSLAPSSAPSSKPSPTKCESVPKAAKGPKSGKQGKQSKASECSSKVALLEAELEEKKKIETLLRQENEELRRRE
jgi:hypothetical protein